MIIAVTSEGTTIGSKVDPRFGRAQYFVFMNDETKEITTFNNTENGSEAHGAGPKAASVLFDNQVNVLITGNGPGGNAATVLEKAGINIYIGAGGMTIEQAIKAYKNSELKKF